MRTFTKLLFSCFLLFFLGVFTNVNAQIITDGGVDTWAGANDLTNWTEGAYVITQGADRTGGGLQSVSLPAGDIATAGSYLYQVLVDANLTAGTNLYTVTLWAKKSAGDNGLQVGIYDNDGTDWVYADEIIVTGEWVEYSFITTLTKGTEYEIRFAGGTGTTVLLDDVEIDVNDAPTVNPVTIDEYKAGAIKSGTKLVASVTYADDEGDAEGTHTYQWYSYTTSGGLGETAISGATNSYYIITSGDVGKFLKVKVTPVALTGTSPGTETASAITTQVLADAAPTCAPTIGGTAQIGQTLTADPVFDDDTYDAADNDNEGIHTYQWYTDADGNDGGEVAIGGATSSTYTLTGSELGLYIRVKVTPVATTGTSTGVATFSDLAMTGPVTAYYPGIPTMVDDDDGGADIYVDNGGDGDPASVGDGDTNVPLLPRLEWAANAGSGTTYAAENNYQLQIANNVYFYNPDVNKTAAWTTSYSVLEGDGLQTNTKYYWRVRAKDAGGDYSPWSATWTFTTTPVVQPYISWPTGGVTVYTNSPTLYWYTGTAVDNLKFQLDLDNDGNVDATTDWGELNYEWAGRASNTTYTWKVRSFDGTNSSDWSDDATFKTSATNAGPVVPVGTWPVGGAYVYTTSPSLYWYVITQVTGLEFEIYLSTSNTAPNGGTTPTYDSDDVGDANYFDLSGLASNTTYYWWVRSTDGITNSDWSERYSFKTTASSGDPVVPVPTFPIDGTTVYSGDVTLYWYETTVATDHKYDVEYNTTNSFTGTATESGLTTQSYTISGAAGGSTYYWKVRSTNSDGSNPSDWSAAQSFTVDASSGAVGIPYMLYPTGGITTLDNEPELSWGYPGSTTGITFEIKYSLYPDLSSPLATPSPVPPNATTYQMPALASGTTYYWAVRASDGSVYSAWAETTSFVTPTTGPNALIVPNLGSPIRAVAVDTESPELSWFLPTAGGDGLQYEIQYSKNADFSNATIINSLDVTNYTLANLSAGETYYWRVRSKAADGSYSSFSVPESFIAYNVTDVEDEQVVPNEFSVSQNYPNPFNPTTMIRYTLPEASFVSIKVYDMLGREVKTLLSSDISAGTHSVNWNGVDNYGAKVASGTYIYRVIAGNKVVSRKMLLLK